MSPDPSSSLEHLDLHNDVKKTPLLDKYNTLIRKAAWVRAMEIWETVVMGRLQIDNTDAH